MQFWLASNPCLSLGLQPCTPMPGSCLWTFKYQSENCCLFIHQIIKKNKAGTLSSRSPLLSRKDKCVQHTTEVFPRLQGFVQGSRGQAHLNALPFSRGVFGKHQRNINIFIRHPYCLKRQVIYMHHCTNQRFSIILLCNQSARKRKKYLNKQ